MGTPIHYPSKMSEQLILGKLKPNFTVLPRTLHMGVTIVFGRVMGTPIHYPGKMSEQLTVGCGKCPVRKCPKTWDFYKHK